jgi:hypothetical protein
MQYANGKLQSLRGGDRKVEGDNITFERAPAFGSAAKNEKEVLRFDNKERANGHKKECRDTFKFMDAIGHYPYMPPTAPARRN